MAREEVLRRRPCLLALPNFTPDLSAYVEAKEQAGESTNIILVTYNRVGEGLLEPRTTKGGLTLDVYQGWLASYITAEQLPELLADETGKFYSNLTPPEVVQFYSEIKDELARQVLFLENPTFFVVYGGEGEKFKAALGLIDKLSFLAGEVGKGALAKFYLLTCNCDLAQKARMTEPQYSSGQLQTIVYNPAGVCGGLGDLQVIAAALIGAIPEA